MRITTVSTPDGPFTLLVDDEGSVLASGWTDDVVRVLDRVPARARPAVADVVVVGAGTPAGRLGPLTAPLDAVRAYYDGDLRAVDSVPVRQVGTEWRLSGWARLREIPPGAPLSYTDLARALGSPTAVRAAASICATNAPALFVPCHRVLRSDGTLGGFAWGLVVKQSLLTREATTP